MKYLNSLQLFVLPFVFVSASCRLDDVVESAARRCVPKPSTGASAAAAASQLTNGTDVLQRPDQSQASPVATSAAPGANLIQNTVGIQTSLTLMNGSKNYSVCTGVVLGRNLVLTAAHCFFPASEEKLKAYSGTVITAPNLNLPTHRDVFQIAAVALHPEWNGVFNDMALVLTERPLPDFLRIVPVVKFIDDVVKDKEVFLLGFGITGDDRKDSGLLRYSQSAFHSEINAQNYAGISIRNQIRIKDEKQRPSQACSGDSGGPAYVKSSGRLLGVVSGMQEVIQRSVSCAAGDVNYTFIAPYSGWIEALSGLAILKNEEVVPLSSQPIISFRQDRIIQPTQFVMKKHQLTYEPSGFRNTSDVVAGGVLDGVECK